MSKNQDANSMSDYTYTQGGRGEGEGEGEREGEREIDRQTDQLTYLPGLTMQLWLASNSESSS